MQRESKEIYIIHQLDVSTSGLVVVGLNKSISTKLHKSRVERKWRIEYQSVVKLPGMNSLWKHSINCNPNVDGSLISPNGSLLQHGFLRCRIADRPLALNSDRFNAFDYFVDTQYKPSQEFIETFHSKKEKTVNNDILSYSIGLQDTMFPPSITEIDGVKLKEVVPSSYVDEASEEAITEFFLEDFNGSYARYRLVLHTEVTHQIRCQFAAIGAPIVGDSLYNNNSYFDVTKDVEKPDSETSQYIPPLALQASVLEFPHPKLKDEFKKFKLSLIQDPIWRLEL
ncbi:pseudouridine synthase [Rozella allomycis CSF55]|uniref:Pseudouridine synthase n=1 Tax=Rozella allomycis (strain CSF55) TaxID=988480 RepID=A0A4P9YGJ0_ROZAC|nr:pseudouridine synthase [Rozella allomycis CSF55]